MYGIISFDNGLVRVLKKYFMKITINKPILLVERLKDIKDEE